jgi:hypothetical protein
MMFRQAFDEKRKNEITTQEFMDRIFSWNSHRTLKDFVEWGIYEPETDTLHIV